MKKRSLVAALGLAVMVNTLTGCGYFSSERVETASVNSVKEEPGEEACTETTAYEVPAVRAEEEYCTDEAVSEAPAVAEYDMDVSYDINESVAEEECMMEYGVPDCMIPEIPEEKYSYVPENGFNSVASNPLSTFSADVDTASYSNIRNMFNSGYMISDIPEGAVRIEEMINYFSYDYKRPRKGEPFSVNAEISSCPWNTKHQLMMLGLQTDEVDFKDAPDSNLVFLIDVSGSMYDDNKLPLLKKAFAMLIDNLSEKDRVSIVTYAGSDEVLIKGVPASNKKKIMAALDSLEASGSTNGGRGILSAYNLAEKYYIEGGNNRVLLATDGDFNVGITSESGLYDLIDAEKDRGIFLSVLGFGMGNYSDSNMEMLADAGNGNYAYIDDIKEAKKVLVEELGATMVTVAKDVKFQVEFNPAVVKEYRLIGYENRALADEDFENDKKDAGEIGAGHSVTVLYELVLKDGYGNGSKKYKYQGNENVDVTDISDEFLTVSVRYKEPAEDESKLLEYPIGKEVYRKAASNDFRFASAVAEFGMILRNSEYLADGDLHQVRSILEDTGLNDEYKQEFAQIVYGLSCDGWAYAM